MEEPEVVSEENISNNRIQMIDSPFPYNRSEVLREIYDPFCEEEFTEELAEKFFGASRDNLSVRCYKCTPAYEEKPLEEITGRFESQTTKILPNENYIEIIPDNYEERVKVPLDTQPEEVYYFHDSEDFVASIGTDGLVCGSSSRMSIYIVPFTTEVAILNDIDSNVNVYRFLSPCPEEVDTSLISCPNKETENRLYLMENSPDIRIDFLSPGEWEEHFQKDLPLEDDSTPDKEESLLDKAFGWLKAEI